MRQRERDNKGNPAATFSQVQQLLAIAVGETDVWAPESRWWDVEKVPTNQTWDLSEQDLEGFEEDNVEGSFDLQANLNRKRRGLNRHMSMNPEFDE